jgi:hypothetical protein
MLRSYNTCIVMRFPHHLAAVGHLYLVEQLIMVGGSPNPIGQGYKLLIIGVAWTGEGVNVLYVGMSEPQFGFKLTVCAH